MSSNTEQEVAQIQLVQILLYLQQADPFVAQHSADEDSSGNLLCRQSLGLCRH
jgi:hypothetical protein